MPVLAAVDKKRVVCFCCWLCGGWLYLSRLLPRGFCDNSWASLVSQSSGAATAAAGVWRPVSSLQAALTARHLPVLSRLLTRPHSLAQATQQHWPHFSHLLPAIALQLIGGFWFFFWIKQSIPDTSNTFFIYQGRETIKDKTLCSLHKALADWHDVVSIASQYTPSLPPYGGRHQWDHQQTCFHPHRNHLQEERFGGDDWSFQCDEVCHGQPHQQQQKQRLCTEVLCWQDRHSWCLQVNQSHL